MRVVRILGIDPGSRLTGYGLVDVVGNQLRHVAHGTLKLASTSGKATIPLEQRLLLIHEGLTQVIREHKPSVMSVERVFFAKNAVSALKLGQARGAAILSGAIHGLNIVEYSPTEVKASVVGHGQADKDQVAKMIQLLLGKLDFSTTDASDGLALAICHANAVRSATAGKPVVTTTLNSTRKKHMSLAETLGITPEMVAGKRRLNVREKG
jgi:crossover junction endodeoxyribonuclease RuvC